MKAVRYTVKITAIVEVLEKGYQEHTVLEQVPYSEGSNQLKTVHGWTQPIDRTKRVDLLIFDQTVDTLDMAALVCVINGIAKP
jgi:hypothetical protein